MGGVGTFGFVACVQEVAVTPVELLANADLIHYTMGALPRVASKTNFYQFNSYWSKRQNKQSTYIMNGAVNGYGALGARAYKLSQFNPIAYGMWEPDEPNYYTYYPGQSCYNDASSYPSQGEGLGRLHGKRGGNLLGFDAHLQSVTYEYFNKERLNFPGLLHCVPGSKTGD